MIETEYGYEQTLHWLKVYENSLERKKKEYLPHNPGMYRILTGGTISQIEDLKRDIADYERRHLKKAG